MTMTVGEMGGVWASKGSPARWVELREVDTGVQIVIGLNGAVMSVEAARALARQLYRHARRSEARGVK